MTTELFLVASLLLNVVLAVLLIIVMGTKTTDDPSLEELLLDSIKSANEVESLSNEVKKVKLKKELTKLLRKGNKT